MSTMLRRSVSFLALAALVLALALPAAARPLDERAAGFSLADLWGALIALVMPAAGAVEERVPGAPARPDLSKSEDGGESDDGDDHQRHWLQIEPGG